MNKNIKLFIFIKVYCEIMLVGLWLVSGVSRADTQAGVGATQEVLVHPALGKFKLVERFVPRLKELGREGYELLIYAPDGALRQTLELNTSLTPPLKFTVVSPYDVDGDGYADLMLNQGYGASPIPLTTLFRYQPASGLFIKDKAFRGFGFPVPSERRGCVYQELRMSVTEGYVHMELCEDPVQWRIRRSCSEKQSCYAEIEQYTKAWASKRRELTK